MKASTDISKANETAEPNQKAQLMTAMRMLHTVTHWVIVLMGCRRGVVSHWSRVVSCTENMTD